MFEKEIKTKIVKKKNRKWLQFMNLSSLSYKYDIIIYKCWLRRKLKIFQNQLYKTILYAWYPIGIL